MGQLLLLLPLLLASQSAGSFSGGLGDTSLEEFLAHLGSLLDTPSLGRLPGEGQQDTRMTEEEMLLSRSLFILPCRSITVHYLISKSCVPIIRPGVFSGTKTDLPSSRAGW